MLTRQWTALPASAAVLASLLVRTALPCSSYPARYLSSPCFLRVRRVKNMIAKMDELGFGNCTNTRACEAVCPKNETISNIARLNREMIKAKMAD